ncbi:MAG: DUF4911 domain-containing protein [Deltaproteobacteria bacterium]|nr:DUF4911 domain-containing protein [Deltaproteobacteria bacterium]
MIEKRRLFLTEKRYMSFLRDILESYEDVCMMSVTDEKQGLIEIIYPDSQEYNLNEIILDLIKTGIPMLEVKEDKND